MKTVSSMRFWIGHTMLLIAATAGPSTGWTQDYPSHPIRFIVPVGAGGQSDLMARSVARKLIETWGQQVIIDNRPSGGGSLGMQIAAKAAPDGYTLLWGSSTHLSITPALRPDVPYDPIRDYTPITQVSLSPVILTVQPSHPARSLQELLELVKAKPGMMNYSTPGYGGAPHIGAELLKRSAGIDFTHVPYKSGADALTAVMGGHVQMSFGAVSTSLPHIRAGRMRALGVTSAKRLTAIADVPTFAEAGLPGFEVVQWNGVFAPSALPSALTRKLNQTLVRALNVDQFQEGLLGARCRGPELDPRGVGELRKDRAFEVDESFEGSRHPGHPVMLERTVTGRNRLTAVSQLLSTSEGSRP